MSNEEVNLTDAVTHHLPEHEILLSFVNDSGAIKFVDWWYDGGKEMFDKYCEECEDDNS